MGNKRENGIWRAVIPLFLLSIGGIASTALFQLLVIRGLGPAGFGVLASYLALINVASMGSSALRNSVAVGVARADLQTVGHSDKTLLESLIYGLLFIVVVLIMLLTGAYESAWAGVLVAVSVIPYFVFARAQGLMQGDERATRVLTWSTGAQVIQLVFVLLALIFFGSWFAVLSAIMLVAVLSAIASSIDVRRLRLHSHVRPFSPISVKALLTTVSFTWLISMDVTWVQQFASASDAGEYGSVATVVKVAFLVPTTLALYLLPRFARKHADRSFQIRAVTWSSAAAAISGVLLITVLCVWPDSLTLLLGNEYSGVRTISVAIALAFLPWVISQAIITQLTAQGATGPVIVLFILGVGQYFLASSILPDIDAWILAQGCLGLLALIASFGFFRMQKEAV